MSKEVIAIPTGDGITLWVFGINSKDEIVFKSSLNIGYTRSEPYIVQNRICYVGTYFFPVEFLNKLPKIIS